MPRGKTTGKVAGKSTRQLLFSEALQQQKHPSAEDHSPLSCANMTEDTQGATMGRILQEISMRLDLAGFQSQLSGLDQRVTTVETQVASWTDRDLELSHLRRKLSDLEDKSRRNNVRLLGFLEGVEGADIVPEGTQAGPQETARTQGLLRSGNLEIQMSADFSKETADGRKAFLSFHTQLRRLEVKFGLFEPARMWITKNGESLNFYDPEDLRTFLKRLQDQAQSMEMTAHPL
ncbi:hypothetical protein NDU88_000492 [Pleurodeles waltl]|uniref:Uncharacterized protein n=1 Tax=Pleurodeles waltl TaxID=8319 RepID=A0AAV7P108_PLEWA|nr:hypothetical protein NDU88_000492 [Pleurodeles waltl]